MKTIETFLQANNFYIPAAEDLTRRIYEDMVSGLKKEPSDQPMITSSPLPQKKAENESIIVIDAGGTNFRSCLVTFMPGGNYKIEHLRKTFMPATDRSLSKDEFYGAIAQNISYLKNKASKIGFCFSYAIENTQDGDARILAFSKEVKAEEAIGTFVGKELKETLKSQGWENIDSIKVLNDTTAALFSGMTQDNGLLYSSFAGFILGTGINNAYIEHELNRVVVCECGMFRGLRQSTFDESVDKDSAKPGASPLEKMCSGVYMGKLCYKIMEKACFEGYFSDEFSSKFKKIDFIEPADMSLFLENPLETGNVLGFLFESGTATDRKNLEFICETIVLRTAVIVSSVLAATILRTAKAPDEDSSADPVCIVCNGSTFWKTTGLYKKILSILQSIPHLPDFRLIKIEDDITLGTAIAAL